MSNQSWGNSFNGNMNAMIKVGVDDSKRKELKYFSDDINQFQLSLILLRELCGTYKFKTENEELLKLENNFFFNLYFWGIVGLWYDQAKQKFRLVKIMNLEADEFGDVIKCQVQKADTAYVFAPSYVQNDGTIIELRKNELENLIICRLDITSEPFIVKYGWMTKEFISIFDAYKSTLELRAKGFFIFKNNNQEQVWNDFKNSMKDMKTPWITITNPQILGNNDASMLMEKPFAIEQFQKQASGYVEIEEVIKFWKFAKDLIGMNAATSQKKERVISSEMEESEVNTQLMGEVEMKNFRIFSKELKNKCGIDLEIIKTKDEFQERNISKHLENESIVDEGVNYEQEI